MPEPPDMSAPVTHAQLNTALSEFRHEFRHEMRGDLEVWGGALLDRLSSELRAMREEMGSMEHRLLGTLRGEMGSMEHRLMGEMANANQEALSTQVSVVDDKYADLPGRVDKLERTVAKRTRR